MAEENKPVVAESTATHHRKKKNFNKNILCDNMSFSAREAFKRLRTNVLIAFPEESERKCHVIGITSSQASEGKSTVAINLAYSLAELGHSVLLVDADMRRPSTHEKLDVRLSPGLTEILLGSENLGTSAVRYQSASSGVFFDMITAGEIPPNPSELLNSNRFKKFISAVSTACDFVIIDLPPVNMVVDAVNVSKVTDGMVVVVREDHVPRYVLAECVEQLRYAKANIIGFVMNGSVVGSGKRYQYGRGYYGTNYAYTSNSGNNR